MTLTSIKPIIELAAAFASLIALAPIVIDLAKKSKGQAKSGKVLDIIKNLDKLKTGKKIKAVYIYEYKRLAFLEIHKLNLSYKNQKRLYKFYKKLEDNFTWTQLKTAAKFFDYSGKKITIKIPLVEWIAFFYFSLTALFVFSLGILEILFALEDKLWYINLAQGFAAILAMSFSFFIIGRFIAPVNVALMIRKHIRKL